jgi:predicted esterase
MFGSRSRLVGLLAVAVTLSLTLTAQGEPNKRRMKIGHYTAKAEEAYKAEDWPQAIRYYGYVLRHDPFSPGVYYNLACCHARSGESQQALEALEEAIAVGWDDAQWMQQDTDLVSLRTDPRFVKLLRSAARCHNERVQVYWPEALDKSKPAPVVVALHGLGGTARGFGAYWRAIADEVGMVVVAVRGLSVWGPRQQMSYAWHKGADPADLDAEAIAAAIGNGLDVARKVGKVDAQRVVLAGFSQGAVAALTVAMSAPAEYSRVIAFAAEFGKRDKEAIPSSGDAPIRVAMIVGERDPLFDDIAKTRERIEQAGHRVMWKIVPVIGREFPADYVAVEHEALKFVLGT